MNIIKEEAGKLTMTLKVEIRKEDYSEKVEKILREQQRKAAMPGFRPGKVPFGMIRKMYGKSVILDEINQMISENLNKYIQDNQFRLIGNPLPNKEKSSPIDLDSQEDFEFYFDLGLAPEVSVPQLDKLSVEYFNIKASDKMTDEYIEDLRRRFGKHEHHEGEEDHHEEPAELNEDFFRMVFPGEDIQDLAAFRLKVREGIEKSLERESERHFMNTVTETLVEKTEIELPEDFIRRWLEENHEGEAEDAQLETRFENFTRAVRWQLIESKIVSDHGIKVEEGEMRGVVRDYFNGRVLFNKEDEESDKRMEGIIDSVLGNKDEAGRIHDQLFEKKLLDFFRSIIKMKQKDITYDDFVKKVTQKGE